ncbi:MAG: trigger factor [bacterium]|nr:trigger factor [bacterium]
MDMSYTIKQLPKSSVEISFEVSTEELQPYLEDAAERIAKTAKIDGFRPGHAPYSLVEKKVGAMKILEEALETVVRSQYIAALTKEKLETVGSPRIDIKKAAPGNPLLFSATVSLLPAVTKLGDYRGIKAEQKPIVVADEEVEKLVRELQRMQTRETKIDRALEATDKAIVNLSISQNKVPVEGGAVQDHQVFMDEPYYIPGFTEQILGMKVGEEKTFTLSFPDSHYQKMLAGKPADFTVTLKEVFAREHPPLDETFAKALGKESMEAVRALLRTNLEKEKQQKEDERFELEILQKIVDQSQFEDIPELLVNEEVERMRQELERGVAAQGLEWKVYLNQIKKTEAELKLEFAPQAIRRIKTTLVLRAIAQKENVEASEKEIDDELDRIASFYEKDKEIQKQIYAPDHRDHVSMVLKNRKTLGLLKTSAGK